MKKNHYIYIGIGLAVLLLCYFAFSCKDCKGKNTPKAKQESRTDDTVNVVVDQREL